MKTFVKTAVAAALLAVPAAALALAPATAHATAQQDSQYIACVAQDGLYNNSGPAAAAAGGRMFAADIAIGVRTVAGEQRWVFLNTPMEITQSDANVLVNCATEVYLGFGPGSGAEIVL
jgi:hypothetical protein